MEQGHGQLQDDGESLLRRRFSLVHESDCLAGKPGPPVQFRKEHHQREHENLRHDKIPPEIGKDRSLIDNDLLCHLHGHDHPNAIGQEAADEGSGRHRGQGQ